MPLFVQLAPFIPFLAIIPPSLAAMWIASRWLKTRGTTAEIRAELAAVREERLLSQIRESNRELPRAQS